MQGQKEEQKIKSRPIQVWYIYQGHKMWRFDLWRNTADVSGRSLLNIIFREGNHLWWSCSSSRHLQRSYQIYLKCEISGSAHQSQLCPCLWRGQSSTPHKHRRMEILIVGFFGAAPSVIPLLRCFTLAVREGQVLQIWFLWSVGEPIWALLE